MIYLRLLLQLVIIVFAIQIASADKDCFDISLESGEPIVLIGVHPLFYGPTTVNHFMNYNIIDNTTIQFTNHSCNHTRIASTRSWEEIRPGVYHDGFKYFKLFIYRQPQRYWKKMI